VGCGAVLAGVLGTSSRAASEPTQIEYMCSPIPTGPMRYVKSLSSCTQQEKKVAVYPGPQYLCVGTGIVTLGTANGPCPAGQQKTKVPGGPPTFYCANKATGRLRGVNPGLPCTSGENQMAIGPDVPPTVTSTSPADGTQNVALNSTISVTFDQSVQATTSSFTLECPAGTPKSYTLSASPATTFTLTPTSNLPTNTTCKVTVVAANIVDADGDLHMVTNYSFSFKTIAAPMVTSTSPANGATSVPTQTTITINFSQSVNATGTAFKLECPTGTPKSFSQSATPATSVTLTPTSPLPVSTVCTVTVVASQVTDASNGTPMLANYVFSFTIDSPPTVTSTSPTNGATNVATTATVTVNFSEQVAATTSSFKLECPSGTPVAYSLSSSPASSFTLTPNSNLPSGTVCTVTVVAAQVHDTDANTPLQADYVFSFTVDTVATVTSTVPTNSSTASPSTTVTINFSESVSTNGSSFKLECPTGTPEAFTVTPASPASSYVLHPTSTLPFGVTCTVTVVANQVHDVDSGSPMAANYVFSFSTGSPPAVTTTTPTDGATDVSPSTTITVNFNKPVNATTSSFKLECPTGTPKSYSLSSSPASTYTLTPTAHLPSGTTCTVTVVANQVTSVDFGLNMTADYVFSFATAPAPMVTSTNPANGATNVATNTTITVNFNRSAIASTSSFDVECPTGTPIAYTLSASPSTSYTLTPNSPLPGGVTCTVTVVASQVTDASNGTPMDANYVFSFGTDVPPTVTTTTPANGATDVATTAAVTVNFSESVNASTSSFSLECPSGTPIAYSLSSSPASSFTLTPNANLPSGTICSVTVHASQVHDVDAGSPMASDYSFSFTVDTVPTVTSTVPTNGGTVGPNSTVTINFSKSVTVTGSAFTLECPSGTPVSFSVTPASPASSYVLHPTSSLPVGTTCAVKVVASQVTDSSGSPMAADYSFSFDVASPPAVTTTSPADGATGVHLDATITVNFSKQVNATTSSFKLECPTGTPESYNLSASPASSFTLTPTSNLPSDTQCTVTVVANQVTSTDFGLNMDSDYVFSFHTVTAPQVTSTVPANNATGVATNATITVNFDRSVNATTSSFDVECPLATPISYSLSASPASSYTLTPNSPLPGGVTCTVTVVAAQVTDASNGTPMDANYVFSFGTDVPPTVTSTNPTDLAVDVNAGTQITVNFSEPVNASASSFSLECPSGTPITHNTSSSPASTFTLTPTSALPAGTTCAVTVHASTVTDVDAGSPMANDYSFSFTTDTPPTVTTTVPTNGAVDVNAGTTITINFSKSVSATGSAFSLECPTGTPVSFNTSSSPASSYTLTPTSALPASTVCTVTVHHTQITDASSTTLAADYTFSFTVDTPPTVTSTVPTNGATMVPLASTITINFSKSVTATSAFSLECPVGTPISFNTSASPANSYTLTPTSNLPPDTTCTVTVHASGIKDASNTNMVTDYTFTFHTVLPPPDAVNDGPSTDYSATGGVPINIGSGIGVLNNDTLYGGSISSYGASTGLEDSSIGTATATAQGGFITLNSDGSFHYDPPSVPPGGGTDTFKYTLTNTTGSDTATVTLNVTHQLIFVNGSSAVSPKTGSLDHPYTALSDIPSSRNTGGVIFFYSGSYTRNDADGVTLKNSEYLIGQGVSLASNLPFTLAPDSVSLPSSNTNPTVSTTFAGGNAVVLGSGNTVKGITLGGAPGYSLDGSSFGTLSIANTTINNTGAGGALFLSTGAIGASSSLDSVSASPSGTPSGVNLTSVTGTLPFNAGSIAASNATPAFTASGGSVSVTDSGSLSQSGTGALLSVAGGHTGTLTFQTGTVSATGGTGLQFNNADGTYTFSNGSTLNGGNAAVSITNGSSGTMNLNSSPITNPSGTAFTVTGSNATVSDSGAISKTSSGQLVDIESNTGGSVGLSGSLSATSSASGIKLASNSGGTYTFSNATKTLSTTTNDAVAATSNTGATIHFSGGGLAATTTSGAGFKATGGGTIDVTGSNNTISTTTGTALDVEHTTISASGLTFQSISANGGSHGIVLDTTGSNAGLTVTGTGSAGSGGSIQGITGSDLANVLSCGSVATSGGPAGVGIFLNSTKSPSFTNMNFTGTFGNFGILGFGVSGSTTLDHLSMTGTFGNTESIGESTVYFCNLTGSAAITNDTIGNGAADNIAVLNDGGSLNRLTMTNDTINANQVGGNIGTLIEGCIAATCGSATTLNTTVEDSTFNGANAAVVVFLGNQGSTMDTIFGQPGHPNTVHNNSALTVAPGSENFEIASNGVATFDVNSDHFDMPTNAAPPTNAGGVIINAANSAGNLMGYFRNNTIGSSGVANSGSWIASGLDAETNGGGTLKIQVANNLMYQWGDFGFFLKGGGNPASGHAVDATVTGNTMLQPGTFAQTNNGQGFQLDSGIASSDNFTMCLDFAGNTINGSGNGQSGGDARLRQRFDTHVQMPGYTGAAGDTAAVDSYIQGLNPTGSPVITSISSTGGGGGFFNTPGPGSACPLPTN
jgi:methionine-rich copper-binding protein CopC